jgi:hypothetical protein
VTTSAPPASPKRRQISAVRAGIARARPRIMEQLQDSSGTLAIATDRRRTRRICMDLGATMQKSSLFYTCRVGDLSETGALLTRVDCEVHPGHLVSVAFPLHNEVVMVRAEVRWTRGALAGIEFMHLSRFDCAMITAYCRTR